MATFTEESNQPGRYSAVVSTPVAMAAFNARNAITAALNGNIVLGPDEFEMTPVGTTGYEWRNNRFTIYLTIPEEDETAVNWQNLPPGYVPEGYDTLQIEITIFGQVGEEDMFPPAVNAIKNIIQTAAGGVGAGRRRRHRRKTRKGGKKRRTTHRHH
jgi:hypothetical protein